MFRNYLKIALRNLAKDKLHAGINIFGLAMGFVVMTLSLIYIKSEWDYDKWLPNSDRIYRAYRSWTPDAGGWVAMPGPFATMLKDKIPGVEKATHIMEDEIVLLSRGKEKIYVDKVAYVDSSFFQVFGFPFLHGDRPSAMSQQSGLVLNEKVAQQFFGNENPIGKVLKLSGELDLQVTGVIKDTPKNSHLQFDIYARLDEAYYDTWLNYALSTYILKNSQTPISEIAENTKAQVTPIIIDAWKATNQSINPDQMGNWKFQPFHEIHLYSAGFGAGISDGGTIDKLRIFGLIAFIVLLIAAINYMNLATAKAAGRAKEVGMRKVSGAERKQLVVQFLTESVVQALVALSIALVLAEFLLPYFNQITGRSLKFLYGDWVGFLPPVIACGLGIGLLAGIYPAFILSAYNPIKVLKGSILKNKSGQNFRKVLVIGQFSISVVLIIFMLFVFKQIEFMQSKDLGFSGEQVVSITTNSYPSASLFQQRKNEFLNIPGVISATTASHIPGNPPDGGMTIYIEGVEDMQNGLMVNVDPDYDKTLGVELEQGRFFSNDHPSDTATSIVINQAFVDYYKLEDPLNSRIKLFGQTEYSKVIGVVKNFHMQGVQRKVGPTFFIYYPQWGRNYVSLKLAKSDIQKTISTLKEKWASIEPTHPARLSFLDKNFERQYAENERFSQTMFQATLLAIFISILGLFGLASFMAEQRTKEIGVRKVLGASIANLINLLVVDFVKLVVIAGAIAIPVGYWLVNNWLKDFPFRTDINLLPFVVAVLGALILAIVTVSYQSIKVSAENPVKALKME